jgi:hypothetical protein
MSEQNIVAADGPSDLDDLFADETETTDPHSVTGELSSTSEASTTGGVSLTGEMSTTSDLADTDGPGTAEQSPGQTPAPSARTRPLTFSLTGRTLRSRKIVTDEGDVPLHQAASRSGAHVAALVSTGEISDQDAQWLMTSLELPRLVLCSQQVSATEVIVRAALQDVSSYAATARTLLVPVTPQDLAQALYQMAADPQLILLIPCAGSVEPSVSLRRMLRLGRVEVSGEDLNFCSSGGCWQVGFGRPRMRRL